MPKGSYESRVAYARRTGAPLYQIYSHGIMVDMVTSYADAKKFATENKEREYTYYKEVYGRKHVIDIQPEGK